MHFNCKSRQENDQLCYKKEDAHADHQEDGTIQKKGIYDIVHFCYLPQLLCCMYFHRYMLLSEHIFTCNVFSFAVLYLLHVIKDRSFL